MVEEENKDKNQEISINQEEQTENTPAEGIPDVQSDIKIEDIQIPVKKFFSIPFICLAIILPVCIFAAGIILEKTMMDLPSMYQIENFSPKISAKIYDKDNNLISEFFTERRTFTPIEKIPKHLQEAFIAIEDNDFYDHWGVSIRGIARAASKIIKNVSVSEGGSTITQQLARMMFLTSDKNMNRKLKEMILAIQIESVYSKDEIMQFYANQAYFGFGAYGVQSAALTYFGKNVEDLTLSECATLAAIPKSPNFYNPFKDPKASLMRRNLVLFKMKELGYITEEAQADALQDEIPVQQSDIDKIKEQGGYFAEYVRILLAKKYGLDELYTNGFSVYTTLDMSMQKAAEDSMEKMLSRFDNRRKSFWKKRKQEPVKVQGALLAIDARTGAIRAMVGGRSFEESEFNRAVQAKRQPGSSFKPFVYLAALEEGYQPEDMIEDRPLIFSYNKGTGRWTLLSNDIVDMESMAEKIPEKDLANSDKFWRPLNYDRKYRGAVTLETALALSINTCAVELIRRISPKKVISLARRLGISSSLIDSFSLALGVSEVTLNEMVGAYGVLASGGLKNDPYVISRIEDRHGNIIEQHFDEPVEVVSANTSFVMTNMLRQVVLRGSGGDARRLGHPSAGKTGTTNDFADAWFIGYTNDIAAGVWVGYDDRKIDLGHNAAGGVVAAPIWTDFMKKALDKTPVTKFKKRKPLPKKVVRIKKRPFAAKTTAKTAKKR
ncbi:MAG: PBP1A family penicillin-binding protein [Endomicrobium sp.]|jgi:penicillin-binding protein 1A|nr:PBP1A family penicillin-binding protein [Endomicrobium sp.]